MFLLENFVEVNFALYGTFNYVITISVLTTLQITETDDILSPVLTLN